MSEAGMPPPVVRPPTLGSSARVPVLGPAVSQRSGRRLNPSLVAGGVLVALVIVVALVSFVWTPFPPTRVDTSARLLGPSAEHWFGTDKFGRDVLSRIMVGARTTLFVGVIAVGVAALFGVPLGILGAMGPSWLQQLILRTGDLVLAFPALLLAIMFGAVYGASTLTAMIAIGIASIPSFSRVTRAGGLQVMSREYVLAARVAGRRRLAIAVRHVLPNVSSLIIVQISVSFAIAVLAEAALSFLGLGTPLTTPSWGRMIQESQELLFVAPRLAVIPGVAIAIAVLGFNLLGDGLRDRYDPKLEQAE